MNQIFIRGNEVATKEYVDKVVENAATGGADLSNYYTKEEVDNNHPIYHTLHSNLYSSGWYRIGLLNAQQLNTASARVVIGGTYANNDPGVFILDIGYDYFNAYIRNSLESHCTSHFSNVRLSKISNNQVAIDVYYCRDVRNEIIIKLQELQGTIIPVSFETGDALTGTVTAELNLNEWLNPPMVTNTEYLTTEKLNGKSVYKRLNSSGIVEYRLDGETIWRSYAEAIGQTDYVVANGTSGVWSYWKFNSGLCIAMGSPTVSWSAWTSLTSGQYRSTTALDLTGIFTSVMGGTVSNAHRFVNCFVIPSGSTSAELWATSAASAAVDNFTTSMKVVLFGKWK